MNKDNGWQHIQVRSIVYIPRVQGKKILVSSTTSPSSHMSANTVFPNFSLFLALNRYTLNMLKSFCILWANVETIVGGGGTVVSMVLA